MGNSQNDEKKVALASKDYKLSYSDFIGIGKNGNLWVEDCDVE